MTKNILGKIVAAGALVAWFVAPASAQSIDPNFYYKLSTRFRGPGMKLDVFNGGARNNMTHLEPDQDVSGQLWRFRGNADGTFRLSTSFRGPSMCLDIFNGGPNNNQPHLAHCANLTGQLWLPSLSDTAGAVWPSGMRRITAPTSVRTNARSRPAATASLQRVPHRGLMSNSAPTLHRACRALSAARRRA